MLFYIITLIIKFSENELKGDFRCETPINCKIGQMFINELYFDSLTKLVFDTHFIVLKCISKSTIKYFIIFMNFAL